MDSKTLNSIQKVSKIGKVLSTIAFVGSIVGAVGCLIGIVVMAFVGQIEVLNIGEILQEQDGTTLGEIYSKMSTGFVLCFGEIFLAKIAEIYFASELKDGTPFTFAGAKKMLRLGICVIAIPVGTLILANIVNEIFKYFLDGVTELENDNLASVGLGIMFILGSFLCKYGAEINEKSSEKELPSN